MLIKACVSYRKIIGYSSVVCQVRERRLPHYKSFPNSWDNGYTGLQLNSFLEFIWFLTSTDYCDKAIIHVNACRISNDIELFNLMYRQTFQDIVEQSLTKNMKIVISFTPENRSNINVFANSILQTDIKENTNMVDLDSNDVGVLDFRRDILKSVFNVQNLDAEAEAAALQYDSDIGFPLLCVQHLHTTAKRREDSVFQMSSGDLVCIFDKYHKTTSRRKRIAYTGMVYMAQHGGSLSKPIDVTKMESVKMSISAYEYFNFKTLLQHIAHTASPFVKLSEGTCEFRHKLYERALLLSFSKIDPSYLLRESEPTDFYNLVSTDIQQDVPRAIHFHYQLRNEDNIHILYRLQDDILNHSYTFVNYLHIWKSCVNYVQEGDLYLVWKKQIDTLIRDSLVLCTYDAICFLMPRNNHMVPRDWPTIVFKEIFYIRHQLVNVRDSILRSISFDILSDNKSLLDCYSIFVVLNDTYSLDTLWARRKLQYTSLYDMLFISKSLFIMYSKCTREDIALTWIQEKLTEKKSIDEDLILHSVDLAFDCVSETVHRVLEKVKAIKEKSPHKIILKYSECKINHGGLHEEITLLLTLLWTVIFGNSSRVRQVCEKVSNQYDDTYLKRIFSKYFLDFLDMLVETQSSRAHTDPCVEEIVALKDCLNLDSCLIKTELLYYFSKQNYTFEPQKQLSWLFSEKQSAPSNYDVVKALHNSTRINNVSMVKYLLVCHDDLTVEELEDILRLAVKFNSQCALEYIIGKGMRDCDLREDMPTFYTTCLAKDH